MAGEIFNALRGVNEAIAGRQANQLSALRNQYAPQMFAQEAESTRLANQLAALRNQYESQTLDRQAEKNRLENQRAQLEVEAMQRENSPEYRDAMTAFSAAQSVLQSPRPLEFVRRTFPEIVNQIQSQGHVLATDQDAIDAAQSVAAHFASILSGMGGKHVTPSMTGVTGLSLTPQYGTDAAGNPVMLQTSPTGAAIQTRLPPGVRLSKEPIRIDTGTGVTLIDPVTRQPIGQIQKNIVGQESERQIGEWIGKEYGTIQKAGFDAGGTLALYDKISDLQDRVDTGKLAGVKKSLNEYAQALGVDVEGLDEAQAFQSVTRKLALEVRNPSGGAGMPGAMSDADREFLISTVPNLLNTPGGNKQIIEVARALAKRNQQVAQMAREYKQRKGRFDDGFLEELQQWSNSHPIFNTAATGPARIQSEEEYNALPSGAQYIAPDGSARTKR